LLIVRRFSFGLIAAVSARKRIDHHGGGDLSGPPRARCNKAHFNLNPSNFGSSTHSPPCGQDRIAVLNIGSGTLTTTSLGVGEARRRPRTPLESVRSHAPPGRRAVHHQREADIVWGYVCEHAFVRLYGFRVTEHDLERPWVIIASGRHRVELDSDVDFYQWAHEQWPPDRFTVELDPWTLTPK
jgi:hypothetical protein